MQKKLAYRYKSYIAIGSNVGNWRSNFNIALNLMNKFGHVKKVSRVYFTKPFGLTTQKYFHNAAFLFLTNLFFNELFLKMSTVEKLIKKNKLLENSIYIKSICSHEVIDKNYINKMKNLIKKNA